jgi:rubredoxin
LGHERYVDLTVQHIKTVFEYLKQRSCGDELHATLDLCHNPGCPDMDEPTRDFQCWMCILCGWIYDEAVGDVGSGLAAGTRWEDVPADWVCPDCGVGKAEFEMVAV